jgi:hypothetical protein
MAREKPGMNTTKAAAAPIGGPDAPAERSRLGRPLLMTPGQVLERISTLAQAGNLFRVHHVEPGLYARARRQFGSWAGAVRAAGVDYSQALESARQRALQTRRQRPVSRQG